MRSKILILFLWLCLVNSVLATDEIAWQPLVGVSIGVANTNDMQNQIQITGQSPAWVVDNYQPDHRQHSTAIAGLFVGLNHTLNHIVDVQLGLGYYVVPKHNDSGIMEQSLFSSVSQYAYQYTLASQQLLIESKILFKWRNRLQPYINIGLGGAFSQLGHYTSTPLSPTAGQPPIFTANNQTNFSYSLGVGMEYAMLAKLRLGVGYRYNELGKVSLGNSDNAPESRHLEVKDVTNQAVLATVTYLF